jgi:hypothetical protein
MPLEFGPDGIKTQSLAEIEEELRTAHRTIKGDAFILDENSEIGKEIGIYSERELKIQELTQFLYDSGFRPTSEGVQLDRQLELTGQARQGATKSKVTIYAKGTVGQAVSAEDLAVTVDQTGAPFFNPSAVTLGSISQKPIDSITQAAGVATAVIGGGHSFPLDSYVFVEDFEQDGYNKLALITAITATTFEYLVDSGTVSPGTGSGAVSEASPIAMESNDFGPVEALAGTLINIVGTVPGVSRVENYIDAVLGIETETDPEAKARADATVTQAGGGFREAIIAKLLNVPDVVAVRIFENTSSIIDPDGRPPGSVECFVNGGTDEDVADGVYNSVSDGVRTFGNVEEIITDSQGEPITIQFSRLVLVPLYVDVVITTNSDIDQGPVFPGDGNDQIIAALAAIQFAGGQDVWATTLSSAVLSIPGVVTVTSLEFDITPAPTNTATIVIPPTEFANIDSGDVTVAP